MSPTPSRTRRASRRPRTLAALLALLMALPPQAYAQSQPVRLPELGESASADLSVADERRIGDQIMREGRRDPAYLDDPILHEYLQQLWQPLVAAARARGDIGDDIERQFAWEAFLLRDRSVNAFALPGGYVGVHLGLIALTTTSDQLASVLAHELTHVSQRHIARGVAPGNTASLLAVAALLLGIIAAGRSGNVDAANAAITTGQAAAIQGQLNFSRDMEREADRIGHAVLAAAGFNTAGMAAMFEKLDQATRVMDNGSFPYLRSHPLTVDRISEARNRVMLSGAQASAPTLLHAVMQARARVLMDESSQGLQRLLGGTSSPLLADRVGAAVAGATAAARLKDHARARGFAAEAAALAATATPREPVAERAIGLLQAQLAQERGEPAEALRLLAALAPLPAGSGPSRPAMLLRAQAQLELHRSGSQAADMAALRDSAGALQAWVVERPSDALAWELLAATSEAAGQTLRALRAGAEVRAVLGDFTGAIDRLRAAQQAARSAAQPDFVEASVIDARLRQLSAQRRQIALDARGGRGGRDDRNGPDDTREPPPRVQ